MIEYTQRDSAPPFPPPKLAVDKWYLKGFKDGYRNRRAFILGWPARQQYQKGYAEGLAAAQRDFSEAIRD